MTGFVQQHANRLGAMARARGIAKGVTALRAALPGVSVSADPDGIVLQGRGLWRRWLTDTALRATASLIR
jgi:hypothetical protein